MGSIPTPPKGHIKLRQADNNWLSLLASTSRWCMLTSAFLLFSPTLVLCFITSLVPTWLDPFPLFFCSYFYSLHPSLSLCLSLGFCWSLTLSIPMKTGDGGCRAPNTLRLPFTRALIGLNWMGMNPGIRVCRLILLLVPCCRHLHTPLKI